MFGGFSLLWRLVCGGAGYEFAGDGCFEVGELRFLRRISNGLVSYLSVF